MNLKATFALFLIFIIIKDCSSGLFDFVEDAYDAVSDAANTIGDAIEEGISEVGSTIGDATNAITNGVEGAIEDFGDEIVSMAESALPTLLDDVLSPLGEFSLEAFNEMKNGIEELQEGLAFVLDETGLGPVFEGFALYAAGFYDFGFTLLKMGIDFIASLLGDLCALAKLDKTMCCIVTHQMEMALAQTDFLLDKNFFEQLKFMIELVQCTTDPKCYVETILEEFSYDQFERIFKCIGVFQGHVNSLKERYIPDDTEDEAAKIGLKALDIATNINGIFFLVEDLCLVVANLYTVPKENKAVGFSCCELRVVSFLLFEIKMGGMNQYLNTGKSSFKKTAIKTALPGSKGPMGKVKPFLIFGSLFSVTKRCIDSIGDMKAGGHCNDDVVCVMLCIATDPVLYSTLSIMTSFADRKEGAGMKKVAIALRAILGTLECAASYLFPDVGVDKKRLSRDIFGVRGLDDMIRESVNGKPAAAPENNSSTQDTIPTHDTDTISNEEIDDETLFKKSFRSQKGKFAYKIVAIKNIFYNKYLSIEFEDKYGECSNFTEQGDNYVPFVVNKNSHLDLKPNSTILFRLKPVTFNGAGMVYSMYSYSMQSDDVLISSNVDGTRIGTAVEDDNTGRHQFEFNFVSGRESDKDIVNIVVNRGVSSSRKMLSPFNLCGDVAYELYTPDHSEKQLFQIEDVTEKVLGRFRRFKRDKPYLIYNIETEKYLGTDDNNQVIVKDKGVNGWHIINTQEHNVHVNAFKLANSGTHKNVFLSTTPDGEELSFVSEVGKSEQWYTEQMIYGSGFSINSHFGVYKSDNKTKSPQKSTLCIDEDGKIILNHTGSTYGGMKYLNCVWVMYPVHKEYSPFMKKKSFDISRDVALNPFSIFFDFAQLVITTNQNMWMENDQGNSRWSMSFREDDKVHSIVFKEQFSSTMPETIINVPKLRNARYLDECIVRNSTIQYSGRGYDVFNGNTFDKIDFGLKRRIIKVDSKTRTEPLCMCQKSFDAKKITKFSDFEYFSSQSLEFENSNDIMNKKAFSNSERIQEMKTGMTNDAYRYVVSSKTCEYFHEELKITTFEVENEFSNEVSNLPTVYNDNTKEKYFNFFEKFGTHLVSDVVYGSKIIVKSTFDHEGWTYLDDDDVHINTVASIHAGMYLSYYEYNNVKDFQLKDDIKKFVYHRKSVSAMIIGDNINPIPVKYTLTPLYDVKFEDLDGNVQLLIGNSIINQNTKLALFDYMMYLEDLSELKCVQETKMDYSVCKGVVFNKNTCYQLFKEPRTYIGTQTICKKWGGGVVVPYNVEMTTFLLKNFQELRDKSFWTGINKEKSTDGVFMKKTFNAFQPYQLSQCISSNNGDWIDEDCTIEHLFVCERPYIDIGKEPSKDFECNGIIFREGNGEYKCLKYIDVQYDQKFIDWGSSRTLCKEWGKNADLVVIESEEKQRVINLFHGEDMYWLGLNNIQFEKDKFEWSWINENGLTYDMFDPDSKDISYANCAYYALFKWETHNCTYALSTIKPLCETFYKSKPDLIDESLCVSDLGGEIYDDKDGKRKFCVKFFDGAAELWDAARVTCREWNENADLMIIEDDEKQQWYRSKGFYGWIGLRRDSANDWKWVDGRTNHFNTYWHEDFPRFSRYEKACAMMHSHIEDWMELSCFGNYPRNFACEVELL